MGELAEPPGAPPCQLRVSPCLADDPQGSASTLSRLMHRVTVTILQVYQSSFPFRKARSGQRNKL